MGSNEEKRLFVTEIALGAMQAWYVSWEIFGRSRDPQVRARSIACKAYGLVWHDRHLAKGMRIING